MIIEIEIQDCKDFEADKKAYENAACKISKKELLKTVEDTFFRIFRKKGYTYQEMALIYNCSLSKIQRINKRVQK